jgi:hypothetical protein
MPLILSFPPPLPGNSERVTVRLLPNYAGPLCRSVALLLHFYLYNDNMRGSQNFIREKYKTLLVVNSNNLCVAESLGYM